MTSRRLVCAFIIAVSFSALRADDLPWKFEGDITRTAASSNAGAMTAGFSSFVSSIKASLPLDWFSTYPSGLMLIFR